MSNTLSAEKPPVDIGDILELRIEDVGFGGEGVARHQNLVIWVPFVGVGESVRAEIIEVKKSYARARLLEVLEPSKERVTPQCRYFGECGGCQYQHLDYPTQLRLKHKQISDLLFRMGDIDPQTVTPVVPCPSPYGYRNRILVRSQWNKVDQKLHLGFIRHEDRLVVDVEACAIAEPALNQALTRARKNPPPKGGLKILLRVAPDNWQVPEHSFFQNNFHLLPELVGVVGGMLESAKSRFLIDAYCGVGFFGIELANRVEAFAGVEYDVHAIRAARKNAANRGCLNGEFYSGKTEELLPELLRKWSNLQTSILMDPPRKGAVRSGLELLRTARPRQIIYVSCHPAMLSRDLKILCAEGLYHVEKITPLDMFPQTQHVECVADLRLNVNVDPSPD